MSECVCVCVCIISARERERLTVYGGEAASRTGWLANEDWKDGEWNVDDDIWESVKSLWKGL